MSWVSCAFWPQKILLESPVHAGNGIWRSTSLPHLLRVLSPSSMWSQLLFRIIKPSPSNYIQPHISTNSDKEASVFDYELDGITELYLNPPPWLCASQVIYCQSDSLRELVKLRKEMEAANTVSVPTYKKFGSHYSHPYTREQLNKMKIIFS